MDASESTSVPWSSAAHPATVRGRECHLIRTLAGIACLVLAIALPFQGTRPLFESSEGRYALVAQEMLHSGDWLHPTIDGQPHWTKPPLTYWILAIGMRAFGENAWGARIPGAIALAVTAASAAAIGHLLLGRRAGWWTGLFVATGWLPLAGANAVTTDVFVAMFETVAMTAFVAATKTESSQAARGWILAMWLAFGAAFLTKGPPALLPLLAIAAWRWTRPRADRPRWWTIEGLAAFALVGFGWFVLVTSETPGLLRYFLGVEVVGRVSGGIGRNTEWWKGPMIYLPALLVAAGPASVVAVYSWIRHQLRRARRSAPGEGTPVVPAFVSWWLLVPLAVFLVVPSKLALYVLPLAVPMALFTAAVLGPGLRAITLGLLVTASAAGAVGLRAWSSYQPSRDDMGALAAQVRTARRAQDLPAARIALVTTKPLLGLQFYLDEHLERPDETATNAELQRFASDFVARILALPASPGVLLVVGRQGAGGVAQGLHKAGVDVTTVDGRYWRLILVQPHRQPAGSDVSALESGAPRRLRRKPALPTVRLAWKFHSPRENRTTSSLHSNAATGCAISAAAFIKVCSLGGTTSVSSARPMIEGRVRCGRDRARPSNFALLDKLRVPSEATGPVAKRTGTNVAERVKFAG